MGKTSSTVKNRWNDQHYSSISFKLEKELVKNFKEKCKSEHIPMAEIVRNAMIAFLQK